MIVFCQVSAYSRLSFPSKPVSESLLERQWGTPISTVLAQEWLSWKTVSISLIFFTLYFSHSQKCWEKEVYRCLPIHVFPSSGISLLFPPSVCTLSLMGSSDKIAPWEVSYYSPNSPLGPSLFPSSLLAFLCIFLFPQNSQINPPQTIPCYPARGSTWRKTLAIAVTLPGKNSFSTLCSIITSVCLFEKYTFPFSISFHFRDAGGKTRRQSMLLWAVHVTDVVSPDHLWSWSGGHWCCVMWPSSWLSLIFFWSKIGLTYDHYCAKVTLTVFVCEVKCYLCGTHADHIWSNAKHCNCHIWSRQEEEGEENPGILWSVLAAAATGLNILYLGQLRTQGLCEGKNPRNPMVVKLFYRNSNSA